MKKSFKLGRTGIVMSAILCSLVVCGIVVYAASSLDLSSYKTRNLPFAEGSTTARALSADKWDELMATLETLGGGIPAGAIMAFADRTTCPEGWSRYADADGRFLMGAKYDIGTQGGLRYNEATLEAANLPAHSHYILYGLTQQDFGDNANKRPVVVDWFAKNYPWSPGYNYSNADWKNSDSKDAYVRTSDHGSRGNDKDPQGNLLTWGWASPFDVTNQHIKVLFCKKD